MSEQYSQNDVVDAADTRENLLGDGELMADRDPEDQQKVESCYQFFDLETVKESYLSNNVKAETILAKQESSPVKSEQKGKVNFKTKSFFERLGPGYKDMPVQSHSGFYDKYMTGVNNDKLKKVFLKREFYALSIVG